MVREWVMVALEVLAILCLSVGAGGSAAEVTGSWAAGVAVSGLVFALFTVLLELRSRGDEQ